MPRGYRCIVIAAVGWLIISAAPRPHPKVEQHPGDTQAQIAESLKNIATTYREEAERTQRPLEPPPCGPDQYGSEDDLCAQWKAADAAADSAWWAWVSAILSGVSLGAVAFALGLTIQSNRIARDTARRQLRAYVCFGHVETPDSPGGEFVVQVEWRNNGQTPASNAVAFADWRDMPEGMPDDFDFPAPSDKPRIGRGTIGPGSEVIVPCDRKLPNWILPKTASGDAKVYLWSAIDYVDAFGAMRRTEFAGILLVEELRGGELGMQFTCIAKHNGIDGECLKQPYADCPSHLRPDPTHHEQ